MITQQGFFLLLTTTLFMIVRAKFIIQSPPELKARLEQMYPDGIHYSVANYGDVPFGKSLSGTVFTSTFLENCEFE